MDRKKALKILVISLGVCGLALATIPLLLSLGPSATAGSTLPRLDIKDLGPGDFAFYDIRQDRNWSKKYLVIKEHDGSVSVLTVLTNDKSFIMPDNHWWNVSGICNNFAPETEGSKIVPGGSIRCFDEDQETSMLEEWRWSYQGKNLGRRIADLYSPKFTVEDNEVVIGKFELGQK
jgi:hypothetical protein